MTENILKEIGREITGSMGRKREGLISAYDIIREHMNDDWIPTNKALPKKEGCYLVTFRQGKKVRVIGYGSCRRDVFGEKEGFGWYEPGTEYYFNEQAIIAWRPLPEPYQPKKNSAGIKPSEFAKAVVEMLQSENKEFARMIQSGEWDEMEEEIYEYASNFRGGTE